MNDAAIKQISGGNRMILCTDVIAHDDFSHLQAAKEGIKESS